VREILRDCGKVSKTVLKKSPCFFLFRNSRTHFFEDDNEFIFESLIMMIASQGFDGTLENIEVAHELIDILKLA